MAYSVGKIRVLSSCVCGVSRGAEVRFPPLTGRFGELLLVEGAVKMTVVMQDVARHGHPAVKEQVAAGEGHVPPTVQQAGEDVAFVSTPRTVSPSLPALTGQHLTDGSGRRRGFGVPSTAGFFRRQRRSGGRRSRRFGTGDRA